MKKLSIVRIIFGRSPHTKDSLMSLNSSGALEFLDQGVEKDGVIFYDQIVDNGPKAFLGQSNVEVQIALFEASAKQDLFEIGGNAVYIIVVLKDALHMPDDTDLSSWSAFFSALSKMTLTELQGGQKESEILDNALDAAIKSEVFFPPANNNDDYN